MAWSPRPTVEQQSDRAVTARPTNTTVSLPGDGKANTPPSDAPRAVAGNDAKPAFKITPFGYIEAYYAYNLNRPSNGITNFRGFDNRHGTVSLSTAAVGAEFRAGPTGGRLVFQVGSMPSTYYIAEPSLPGTPGTNASGAELWKYLQEAFVTYDAPVGNGLSLQLGLFASPIGFETFAVKDNWNYSRSNLFFGLPYYQTGFRAVYQWTTELSTAFSVLNGWNSVVDNNEEKSVQGYVTYRRKDELTIQALYLGGVERNRGAIEGRSWRHHFDAVAQYAVADWLSIAGEFDYGWEPTRFGIARWVAGALYARFRPQDALFLAIRGDRFHERVPTGDSVAGSPLFWGGVEWVTSGTITLDARPNHQMSVRLEYRHDVAASPLYFVGAVQGDGVTALYRTNASMQDTLLVGAVAWF